MYEKEKELWVKFACAALSGCVANLAERVDKWNGSDLVSPEDMLDEEDVLAEDCAFAAQYADKMVDLFYDKFKDC